MKTLHRISVALIGLVSLLACTEQPIKPPVMPGFENITNSRLAEEVVELQLPTTLTYGVSPGKDKKVILSIDVIFREMASFGATYDGKTKAIDLSENGGTAFSKGEDVQLVLAGLNNTTNANELVFGEPTDDLVKINVSGTTDTPSEKMKVKSGAITVKLPLAFVQLVEVTEGETVQLGISNVGKAHPENKGVVFSTDGTFLSYLDKDSPSFATDKDVYVIAVACPVGIRDLGEDEEEVSYSLKENIRRDPDTTRVRSKTME